MDNVVASQLKELLDKNNNIAIATPADPTLDEMGAALGVYLALSQSGKTVTIATPNQPLVEVSSLVGIDKVKSNLGGGQGGDLIVSFPYKEGEIEKVSYTLENGLLNIVVKAGASGLSFNQKDVKFSTGAGAPGLLIVVGSARLSDLGGLFNPASLKDTQVVNIDNKPDNQGYGDIVMVSPKNSSISEMIADLIFSLGLRMDRDIAQNLMTGISFATANFADPATSPLAFEMAGVLIKNGAVRGKASRGIVSEQRVSPSMPVSPFDQLSRVSQRSQPGPTSQVSQAQQGRFNQPDQPVQAPVRTQSSAFNQPNQPKPSAQPEMGSLRPKPMETVENKEEDTPPDDWLAPKIYKGSTNF